MITKHRIIFLCFAVHFVHDRPLIWPVRSRSPAFRIGIQLESVNSCCFSPRAYVPYRALHRPPGPAWYHPPSGASRRCDAARRSLVPRPPGPPMRTGPLFCLHGSRPLLPLYEAVPCSASLLAASAPVEGRLGPDTVRHHHPSRPIPRMPWVWSRRSAQSRRPAFSHGIRRQQP